FVDGTTIHDHGDAHAEDGFCNAITKASVTGTIEKNRFKATSFTLIKEK
ncbi:glutaminyl-tRNA synthetase, partial [Flavobacterium sp. MEB061]